MITAGGPSQALSNDAEELEAAAQLAELAGEGSGPPPAPPQPTLRMEDLPPLSDSEKMF